MIHGSALDTCYACTCPEVPETQSNAEAPAAEDAAGTPQVLGNELKEMCRKHNPAHRHRRIIHGMGAVEADEGFGTIVVPQVRIVACTPTTCA